MANFWRKQDFMKAHKQKFYDLHNQLVWFISPCWIERIMTLIQHFWPKSVVCLHRFGSQWELLMKEHSQLTIETILKSVRSKALGNVHKRSSTDDIELIICYFGNTICIFGSTFKGIHICEVIWNGNRQSALRPFTIDVIVVDNFRHCHLLKIHLVGIDARAESGSKKNGRDC